LSTRATPAVAALVLVMQGTGAFACGHCIEDRLAATYDHRVVTRAVAGAVSEINRRLAGRKVALTVLRVLDSRQRAVRK